MFIGYKLIETRISFRFSDMSYTLKVLGNEL
jgi:hypothetical protein